MSILKIRKHPDNILRTVCQPVAKIKAAEKKLLDDMLNTMRAFKGIGLAAPQVGVLYRLIIVDTGKQIIKLADPEISKTDGASRMTEGCLSVPEAGVEIIRPVKITVSGIDEEGNEVVIDAEGLTARIFQHEIDHLNGKLIIDYKGFLGDNKI